MRLLMVAVCFATAVSVAQADSLNCRRVVVASGHHVYMADDMFGLRTIHVRGLQSLAEGAYSSARDSAGGATVPRGHAYLAEAGGALVGGVLVGVGGGLALGLVGGALTAARRSDPDYDGYAGILIPAAVGLALGYPCGCAMGTVAVGRWKECEGNVGLAYSGACIGMLAALPLFAVIGGVVWDEVTTYAAYSVAALLPPAGAVIGYNMGAHRSGPKNTLGARLAPPVLALSTRLSPDRQRYSAFDCRLVTVRF